MKRSSGSSCCICFGMSILIILYTCIVVYVLILKDIIKASSKWMLIALIAIYIFYLFFAFAFPTFFLIRNKKNYEEAKKILIEYIKARPNFNLEVKRKKVNDVIKSYYFPYFSSRDVSGYLDVELTRDEVKKYSFIALHLNYEINFADEISLLDHILYRDSLKQSYKYGVYFEEKRSLNNQLDYILINLGDKQPFGVNCFFYVLFTLIPFIEFYKLYVHSYFYEKDIVIRKIISSRYELNQEKYENYNPFIKFIEEVIFFEKKDFNQVINLYKRPLPSENEINFASKYSSYIPKYECEKFIDIDNQTKIGLIKDAHTYENKEISFLGVNEMEEIKNNINYYDVKTLIETYLNKNNKETEENQDNLIIHLNKTNEKTEEEKKVMATENNVINTEDKFI